MPVSSILLHPHPTEVNAPLLAATSHISLRVEQMRVELLKWIGRWSLATLQEHRFDKLGRRVLNKIDCHRITSQACWRRSTLPRKERSRVWRAESLEEMLGAAEEAFTKLAAAAKLSLPTATATPAQVEILGEGVMVYHRGPR
ncbi:hypothetical protein BDZ97DRAFT_1760664 [Flammula alnicola]|nr:hypothetical protein BDZ97DRAFT_1760664 [Flammula alnicola]